MQWVREKLDEEEAKGSAEVEEELRLQEEDGIECGCCFSVYPFVRALYLVILTHFLTPDTQDKLVQCPEAHLFCTTCMMSYVETKLGEHEPVRVQAAIPGLGAAAVPHAEAVRTLRARQAAEGDRGCGS